MPISENEKKKNSMEELEKKKGKNLF